MKLAICTFYTKSEQLAQADIDVSFKMVKITPQISELDKISIPRVFEVDGSITLALAAGELAVFGSDLASFKSLE